MNEAAALEYLEEERGLDGFLYELRQGAFDAARAEKFLNTLKSITAEDVSIINRRLVSLLWNLPQFVEWQMERCVEKGANELTYKRFYNEVWTAVEQCLGSP